MLLEGHLQIPQCLHLVHERYKFRIVVCVEQVVFKHGKLAWVWKAVRVTILFCQEGVNLSGGEFVRVASLNLSNHRIIRFDALTICLAYEVSSNDFLSHGHWPVRRVHGW